MYKLEKIALKSKFNKHFIVEYISAILFVMLFIHLFQKLGDIIWDYFHIQSIYIDISITYFIGMVVGSFLWVKLIERQKNPLSRLGFTRENAFKSVVKGLALGSVLIVSTILLNTIFNGVTYKLNDLKSVNFLGFNVLFLYFLFQSTAEEIYVRGVLLPIVSKKIGLNLGILFSSVVFSLIHINNSGIGIFALLNLLLVGIFLSYVLVYYENIWVVSMLHFAWNFLQGPIFGFKISGNTVKQSLFTVATSNKELNTFGPEGTMAAALVLFIATIYYYKKCKIHT